MLHSSVCPHCQNPIHSAMRFCRFCGQSLEDVFCPLCKRANRPDTHFCAHCGVPMVDQTGEEPYDTGKIPAGLMLAGRYLVLRKIAQGGMGAVYEAREAKTGPVPRLAIKEMSLSIMSRLDAQHQQAVVESFHREFELLSKLQHPNLVRAYEFFEEQGRQFFVMEYIDGQTFETILDLLPPGELLPVERVLHWARQLCDVLDYLHSQTPQIVYRDLKPSNVMEVYGSQTIKLFDFGIARFYKPGQRSDTVRFGTDGYLAPEIVAYHTQTSERTDVYALGALLHQLLTRYDPLMDPWKRPGIASLNPGVSKQVILAIERAMMLNPSERTSTAVGVLKDLFGFDAEIRYWNKPAPETLPDTPLPLVEAPSVSSAEAAVPPVFTPALPEEITLASAPVALPESPAPIAANASPVPQMSILNLGEVQRGWVARGAFKVVLPPGVSGQARGLSPWLRVEPAQFTTDTLVTVSVQTGNLPLESWKSNPPVWYTGLPVWVRAWPGLHLGLFVPRPRSYQGMIHIITSNTAEASDLVTGVQVILQVNPPAWRTWLGWLLALGLMFGEIGLFLAGISVLLFLL